MTSDRKRSLREQIERRMMATSADLPTSSLGRLRRTATAALRGGHLAYRHARNAENAMDVQTLSAIVASVGQLKGVAMKAGQMMSYLDLPVPPELREALGTLQTHSPPMPFEVVATIVRDDLGDRAPALLAAMSRVPAAAASIGQVHRATLPDGMEVAVKVQYPDIERTIAADFRTASLGTSFAQLLAPGVDVKSIVGEVQGALLDECDYLREAGYQERLEQIYREHRVLTIPSVHPVYCSRRVLTTTWVDGKRFDELLADNIAEHDRDEIGEAIFEFYVGTLFRYRLFNWDPHPGNYLFRPDGRVAILDHGSTREFEPSFVWALAELTRAVHADDRDELHRAFLAVGLVSREKPYDFETARALVRGSYGPMLRDEVLSIPMDQAMPLRALAAAKRDLLKLRFPGPLLFILRIRFGVLSVLARLGARANWYQLERRLLDEGEFP